jgi:Methyltransferase domain
MVQAPVTPLERQQLGILRPRGTTYWHRVRFELVAREAARRGLPRVADLGAGAGQLGEWLAVNRPLLAYTFSEPSDVLRVALVTRFGGAAEIADEARLTAGTMVVMLDVLEHIEDDHAALSTLRRRMEPGSVLMLTVPAMQWAFSSWDTELGHHRRYSRRRLGDDLRDAGFTVQSTSYLFPELFPILVVRRLRQRPRAHVDFPALPAPLDAIGQGVASATTAARRIWPFGTSAVAVATPDP